MIQLTIQKGCARCARLREQMRDLAIASTIETRSGEKPADAGDVHSSELPVMVDEKKTWRGHDDIEEHMEYLLAYRRLWYKYQTDTCYSDEGEDVDPFPT